MIIILIFFPLKNKANNEGAEGERERELEGRVCL